MIPFLSPSRGDKNDTPRRVGKRVGAFLGAAFVYLLVCLVVGAGLGCVIGGCSYATRLFH